ncbi:MAG: LLM class flavin-dependent oxidoreductase [Thaumarchaeota archaeon]|nr:LLM class flavin-dependent oxidoreductase [Nitrososphaerota archaeon]
MKLVPGISFNLAESAQKVAGYVSMAEKEGFRGLALLTDSQLIWRDVYVCFTLALQKTSKIRVGTGVTNPVTRDPTVTAGVIATLDELAPGRVVLGMGVGDSAVHTLYRPPASLKELREAALTIRALIGGREVDSDGKKIRLPWSKKHVPIYIASTGPASLRLAGEVGDGVIVNVGAHPDLIGWALEHLEEGTRRTGRSLKDLDIWVRATCFPHEDVAKATAVVKGSAATKANGLARYAKNESFRRRLSKELLKDIDDLAAHYNYYEHEKREAKHTDFVTERIVKDLVIAGPPEYCRSRIKEIVEKTGLNQISFATYGFADIPGFIKKFMSEVAPTL